MSVGWRVLCGTVGKRQQCLADHGGVCPCSAGGAACMGTLAPTACTTVSLILRVRSHHGPETIHAAHRCAPFIALPLGCAPPPPPPPPPAAAPARRARPGWTPRGGATWPRCSACWQPILRYCRTRYGRDQSKASASAGRTAKARLRLVVLHGTAGRMREEYRRASAGVYGESRVCGCC